MYRRNGSLTSCEPCRVSKVRCDHATPVCRRCQAKGVSEKCFYHPAPMTRPNTRFRPYHVDKPPSQVSTREEPTQPVTKPRPRQKAEKNEDSSGSYLPGYLGFSSTLSLCPKVPTGSAQRPYSHINGDAHFASIEQSLRQVMALSSQFEDALLQYYDGTRLTTIPRSLVVDPTLALLRELRGSEDGSTAKILAKTKENIRRRFPSIPSSCTVSEFLQCFTAENIRLEFISLVFSMVGLATLYTEAPSGFDPLMFGGEMYSASKACLQMCEAYDHVNDLTIWTRFLNVILSGTLFGDASDTVYHGLNELVGQLFIMGFNHLISSPPDIPFFILETRKRVFAIVVAQDKSMATLVGRPPRIDSSFCDTILPLQLTDKEIVFSGAQLDLALQRLDSDGWNRSDQPHWQTALFRLRYQHALIQEKVLRLSLRNRNTTFSQQLSELYEEYHSAVHNIPPQYRYDKAMWAKSSPLPCLIFLVVHLGYLYSGFMIERMLLQDAQITITPLLETSTKLLSGALDFIHREHCHHELRERQTWLFLHYCLPGAGTLATELHQATLRGVPLPTSTPVSHIVRDLSVFLAYFERKKMPNRPDLQVCVQISKVIGNLLDDTLTQGLPSRKSKRNRSRQGANFLMSAPSPNAQVEPDLGFEAYNPDVLPPLPESMTSEDFLKWFDELIWDNPSLGFDQAPC
ncbi:hypothetical protein BDW74DRAFT_185788 [Aspergillus multicolor]|uniref:uncharacterized protein n=1 Tax=Aspergillus multicolor TaxID=41759 RepID=UPI003CCD2120